MADKLPDVNVVIKPEFRDHVLRRDLMSLKLQIDALQEIMLLIYAKVSEVSKDEAKRDYESLFEAAIVRWKASVAKYSDLTIKDSRDSSPERTEPQ